MLNHPTLKDHVGQNDEECLMHLNEVDVQEIDDDTFQGFKYVFRFVPTPTARTRSYLSSSSTTKARANSLWIRHRSSLWKAGHNLCDPRQVSQLICKQAGKRRPLDVDEET